MRVRFVPTPADRGGRSHGRAWRGRGAGAGPVASGPPGWSVPRMLQRGISTYQRLHSSSFTIDAILGLPQSAIDYSTNSTGIIRSPKCTLTSTTVKTPIKSPSSGISANFRNLKYNVMTETSKLTTKYLSESPLLIF